MKLPIDVVPGTNPPKFRWGQSVNTPSGKRMVEYEGPLPPSVEEAVVELVKSTGRLQAFKDWVHAYLDDKGVPKELPDGLHTKEGYRIGDRLDWLVKALTHSSAEDALQAALDAAVKELESTREQLNAANRRANAAEVLNSNQKQMLEARK